MLTVRTVCVYFTAPTITQCRKKSWKSSTQRVNCDRKCRLNMILYIQFRLVFTYCVRGLSVNLAVWQTAYRTMCDVQKHNTRLQIISPCATLISPSSFFHSPSSGPPFLQLLGAGMNRLPQQQSCESLITRRSSPVQTHLFEQKTLLSILPFPFLCLVHASFDPFKWTWLLCFCNGQFEFSLIEDLINFSCGKRSADTKEAKSEASVMGFITLHYPYLQLHIWHCCGVTMQHNLQNYMYLTCNLCSIHFLFFWFFLSPQKIRKACHTSRLSSGCSHSE